MQSLADGREVVAVGVVFHLPPARADAHLDAAAADVVERGGDVREERRVAVGIAGHERAATQPRHLRQQGRQRGPALQARTKRVTEDRDEVVERPRVVEAFPLDVLPYGEDVGVCDVLRTRLDPELDRA